jgi:Domain of unknown function (DUF4386)
MKKEKRMTIKTKTNLYKTNARVAGALFLIAMVTSLVGAGIIETVLSTPDYLLKASSNETQLVLGVLLELTNGIAVIGIAVTLFPVLKKESEALALGYVGFRIIESVIIIAALISPLALIALSQEYVSAGAPAASYFQTVGGSFLEVRSLWLGALLGIVFSLAALIFYYLLYGSRLVPRWISIWGLIAVILLFAWNLLELFGISISAGIILGLPIILNEIFLGIWLIVKGFDPSVIVSGSAQADR